VRARPARLKDAGAFAHVIEVVAAEGGSILTEPPFEAAAFEARVLDTIEAGGPDALFVVEDEDGAVVGNLGLHPYPGNEGLAALGMSVLPHARGRGAGRALMDAAIAHARAQGWHKLTLEVFPDNVPAVCLYLSTGFALEGHRRDHYLRSDGSLRGVLVMGLGLARPGLP
jgi:putative acetyltransferase